MFLHILKDCYAEVQVRAQERTHERGPELADVETEICLLYNSCPNGSPLGFAIVCHNLLCTA